MDSNESKLAHQSCTQCGGGSFRYDHETGMTFCEYCHAAYETRAPKQREKYGYDYGITGASFNLSASFVSPSVLARQHAKHTRRLVQQTHEEYFAQIGQKVEIPRPVTRPQEPRLTEHVPPVRRGWWYALFKGK